MKRHILCKNRRLALEWSTRKLSEQSGIHETEIMWFEEGRNIGTDKANRIKEALYQGFKDLPSLDHYKRRIMELALQINYGELNQEELFQALSHMSIEMGKLQGETLGFSRQYRD